MLLKTVYGYTIVFVCMDVSKFIFHPIQILSLCDVQCVLSAFLGVVNEATIIFPVLLYGCETRSLTLGGETYVESI